MPIAQFVGSMGPPGGGRNPVTNRFLRHFNFISFTEMNDTSVTRIFTTILSAYFKKYFTDAVQVRSCVMTGCRKCSGEVSV